MPRPPTQPERSCFTGEELEAYDKVVGRLGRIVDKTRFNPAGGHLGAMLNSPLFAEPLSTLGERARAAGHRGEGYSHKDREWADQVLSAHLKTNVILERHIPESIEAGVRIGAIEAIRRGDNSALTEDERLLAAYIRQVVTGQVTDAMYTRIEHKFGVRGAVEYTIWIGFCQMAIRLRQAFMGDGPPDSRIDELLERHKSELHS